MGDQADMMLDGTLCEGCGVFLNEEPPGYPCYCNDCGGPGQIFRDMEHACHWTGCKKQIAPKFWGCAKHWKLIPQKFKHLVWKNYKPGQEERKDPSRKYLSVNREIMQWIKENNLEENPC